jgi:hypothetical protein
MRPKVTPRLSLFYHLVWIVRCKYKKGGLKR